jgi:hypothetical protein
LILYRSARLSHGTYVITNNTIPNAIIKGIAFFATIIGGVSDRVPATNKSNPNGGVAKPIDKQQTIITPKCTGWTPKA